jgi:transposase
MKEKEFFSAILGVTTPWSIDRIELDVEKRDAHVYVEYEGADGVCPKCGAKTSIHDKREERIWRDLDSCKYKTYVHCRAPRCKCAEHGVLTMETPWAIKLSHFTKDFESLAITILLASRNQTKVAGVLGLSWDEINGIMQRAVTRGLLLREDAAILQLGIDEKSFGHGQSYASILYDPLGKRVLDMQQRRDEEAVDTLLYKSLSHNQLQAAEAITMDFWQAFINGAEEHLPNAVIVHDKFHIMKYMNDAVDKVRRKENAELSKVKDTTLKGTKFVFLKNKENFTEKQKEKFDSLNLNQLDVGRAWNRKELLGKMWECRSEEEARDFFNRWYFSATHSRLEPVITVAKMIKRHFENIVTYFTHRISNAFAEGINSVIQNIRSTARGFRNFENYRIAVLFYCGGLDLLPQESR